jgi:ABC-type Fe3+ transport system permease subunit
VRAPNSATGQDTTGPRQGTTTLPLLLYQRMAAYQLDAAAVTAVVLAVLCFGLFAVIERGVGGHGPR